MLRFNNVAVRHTICDINFNFIYIYKYIYNDTLRSTNDSKIYWENTNKFKIKAIRYYQYFYFIKPRLIGFIGRTTLVVSEI